MKRLTRQELDAAYERSLQVELVDDIATSSQEARSGPISPEGGVGSSPAAISLPDPCPGCGAGMQRGQSELWTPLSVDTRRADQRSRIMCARCACTIVCTIEVWAEARKLRKDRYARNNPVKVKREKRERGAG